MPTPPPVRPDQNGSEPVTTPMQRSEAADPTVARGQDVYLALPLIVLSGLILLGVLTFDRSECGLDDIRENRASGAVASSL